MRIALLLLLALSFGLPAADQSSVVNGQASATTPSAKEVWITRTGKRYHRPSCQYAKIKATLAEAQQRGLTPCQVCNP